MVTEGRSADAVREETTAALVGLRGWASAVAELVGESGDRTPHGDLHAELDGAWD
jgi:hypothetical protein